jgi:O-antigen ligase
MTRKHRIEPKAAVAPVAAEPAAAGSLPVEVQHGDWTVALLALTMFLAPALGVPHEHMLQDTLKSTVVSFGALGAALLFFMHVRHGHRALRWHALVWLPLMLMAYALGSMAWSHTYLAGVEAIRWFVFALLLWLGLNTLSRDSVPRLAWGIHAGAVVAALWTALQFWIDFKLFPQGPNPGSTFVNRNFFAEFAVCTLPFGAYLLARARHSAVVAALCASLGFVVVTILMTGTRSALIALWLQLLVVLPLIAWRWRTAFAFGGWSRRVQAMAVATLLLTVGILGAIPTGNPSLIEEARVEGRGMTALERGLRRTESIRPGDPSLGVRMLMWRATVRMIQADPVSGVGAGAWEVQAPRFQEDGAQLETDFYPHNEFLQLIAEYGVVAWLFLALLLGYLANAAWRTWRAAGRPWQQEGAVRAVALTSLLALMVVSNVGFPWRMAATGALFALCLAILAASDARMTAAASRLVSPLKWSRLASDAAAVAAGGCVVLAIFITRLAAQCEWDLVRAARLALGISASHDYNNPKWDANKREIVALLHRGIEINPHYRKITPIAADEMAKWGDWSDAIWVWGSVLQSRPYVVAIITNVARGYVTLGDLGKAGEYLQRAQALQPKAPAVRSLQAIILGRSGKEPEAMAVVRQAIADKAYDYDILTTAVALGMRGHDPALVRQAADLLIAGWPDARAAVYLELARMYDGELKDPVQALANYRLAWALIPPEQRPQAIAQVPPRYRAQVQTSASSK